MKTKLIIAAVAVLTILTCSIGSGAKTADMVPPIPGAPTSTL